MESALRPRQFEKADMTTMAQLARRENAKTLESGQDCFVAFSSHPVPIAWSTEGGRYAQITATRVFEDPKKHTYDYVSRMREPLYERLAGSWEQSAFIFNVHLGVLTTSGINQIRKSTATELSLNNQLGLSKILEASEESFGQVSAYRMVVRMPPITIGLLSQVIEELRKLDQ